MSKASIEWFGLDRTASAEDVKQAYLFRAKRAHPDAPEGSQDKFTELSLHYRKAMEFIRKRPCLQCKGKGRINIGTKLTSLYKKCPLCCKK